MLGTLVRSPINNSEVPQNCGSFVFLTSRVTDCVPFVMCHRQMSTPVRRTTVYTLKDVFIVHFRFNQNLPKLLQKVTGLGAKLTRK